MAATEQSFLATPFAGAGGRIIASPFQFVSDDDTNLRVISVNSQAGVTLAIHGRRIDERGELQALNELHTPNADRTTKTQDFKLGKGALLNLTIFATAGTPVIGQTYVMVQFIRGFGGATIVLGTLLSGYVTTTQALGFPGSAIESSIAGGGYPRIIVGTQPPAGLDITETVPTGARWQLITFDAVLTTSAVVANRQPMLKLAAGASALAFIPQYTLVPASQAPHQGWHSGMVTSGAVPGGPSLQGVPNDLALLAGDVVATFTGGLQAADQWSAPVYSVREWLEVG